MRRHAAGALMLAGVVLAVIGVRELVVTGTCSSTGLTELGPAPKCPSGSMLHVGLAMVGLAAAAVGGGMLLGAALVAVLIGAVGLGSLLAGVAPAEGESGSFGLIFGGVMLTLAAGAAWLLWSHQRWLDREGIRRR